VLSLAWQQLLQEYLLLNLLKMENDPHAKILRIFLGESDKYKQQPLYETIVFEAKKQGLSGATASRGIMGFGANSKIHSAKLFDISIDLPIVVEVIDTEDKINEFIKIVEQFFESSKSGGLITVEKVEVIRYKPGK
jgi:uncharacterized protein